MSFNNLVRRRASRSAIQATIADTNRNDPYGLSDEFEFESETHSLGDVEEVRILNKPSGNTISDSSKVVSHNTDVRSEELAILSTSSSASESTSQSFPQRLLYSLASSNSQRIDEWCMDSELNELTDANMALNPSTTCSRVQDMVNSWGIDRDSVQMEPMVSKGKVPAVQLENYASNLLKGLSDEQISIVKQLTNELLPLLRNSRRTHSVFTNRYKDVPSVFPQRDLILACSLRYNDTDTDFIAQSTLSEGLATVSLDDTRSSSSLTSMTWLGWTLVPRLTENDLR